MRDLVFTDKALEQLNEFILNEKRIAAKIVKLIQNCKKTPFEGIGKPEPLKHNLKSYWSRRITKEHRLVYEITDDAIKIISCKDHY
ncbi:UNVERIFIED_CONTAM: hypothetical protein GTU68_022409 [Idotea baltica]|nr:hypothetical protein [Idotea baltica]